MNVSINNYMKSLGDAEFSLFLHYFSLCTVN